MVPPTITNPDQDLSAYDSYNCRESRMVWEFFERRQSGVFVDVGANHPTEQSQTWFLELQGWTGVLVEANPVLARLLQEQRTSSKTFQVAVAGPEQSGLIDLHLAVGHGQSSLQPDLGVALAGETVRVRAQTLDSIMEEARLSRIDFLSLNVEGVELEVLRGLDLKRYQPRLVLIEDHVRNYQKHRFLRAHGYRLVRRTGYNNWYVPNTDPATILSLCNAREIWNLLRKMWLSYPFVRAKRALKKARYNRTPKQGSNSLPSCSNENSPICPT
jgi:FkbM family methyltransferase